MQDYFQYAQMAVAFVYCMSLAFVWRHIIHGQ